MATSATTKAKRIAEVNKSIAVYVGEELRRVTLGRFLIWLFLVFLGFIIGYMAHGTIVIGPPPGPVTPGYNYNLTGVQGP